MKKLYKIDFSDGIRSEEIQENFENLQGQINRERVNIGGPGIASGLEIESIVNDTTFGIKVSSSSIITKDGEEIFIEDKFIEVERPKLIAAKEYLTANVNNQITLNEVPYALSRKQPVEFETSYDINSSGIKVLYQNSTNSDDFIRVKSIDGNVLTLSGLTDHNVQIEYYYTAKRIDTVYIDENNEIKVDTCSITSTTPSAILPTNYKYLIAHILVHHDYIANDTDTPHAFISLKEDLRTTRNIYTDSKGNLYICGVLYNNLQFISMEEPKNPQENQLWLNLSNNTVYIYKKIDKYTYKKTLDINTDYIETDLKDFKTDVNYLIGANELSVYINYIKLNPDEFTEMHDELPVSMQHIKPGTQSNMFRVYANLVKGDTLTYKIKLTEGNMMWIPLNKEAYVNTKEIKIFGVDDSWIDEDEKGNYWNTDRARALGFMDSDEEPYPNKYKYFLFDRNKDKQYLFTPNRNELELLINQVPLHSDQFKELTLDDFMENVPEEVLVAGEEYYGWTEVECLKLSQEYDNLGIGFVLAEPLDSIYAEYVDGNKTTIDETELYVEARLNRAVAETPSKRKLQRNSTYISEKSIVITDSTSKDIVLEDCYYRYDENQLEVFLNGIKLLKDHDYEEGTDIDKLDPDIEYDEDYYTTTCIRMKGEKTRQFTLKKNIVNGDILTYRVTSHFYSYDHINSLLDEIELDRDANEAKIETLYSQAVILNENSEAIFEEMKEEIADLREKITDNNTEYLTTESELKESNMPSSMLNRIPQSTKHISVVIPYNGSTNTDVTPFDIREQDFIIAIHRDKDSKDTFLIRNIDYTIRDNYMNDIYKDTHFNVSETLKNKMSAGEQIILTGIKFGQIGGRK